MASEAGHHPGRFHVGQDGRADFGGTQLNGGPLPLEPQTIDMADAALTLTRVQGTPTGTLLTGGLLFVDPNSAAAGEDLLLPPEADCAGFTLMVVNTGGESIQLKNDAGTDLGGGVTTIGTTETGWVACDGTTWWGGVMTLV